MPQSANIDDISEWIKGGAGVGGKLFCSFFAKGWTTEIVGKENPSKYL